MKKILLLAVASLFFSTANAQLQKKQNSGRSLIKQQVSIDKKTSFKQFKLAGEKSGVKAIDKDSKIFKGSVKLTDYKPVYKQFKANRAGAVQEKYVGSGLQRSTNAATEWEVFIGTTTIKDSTINVIRDLIPNIFKIEGGVLAPYTIVGETIVVQPTLVTSFTQENKTYYVFLESATSSDGAIKLTLNDAGEITGSYDIIYSLYPSATYNYADWIATYDGIKGAQYTIPGVIKVPTVSFETGNLVLFAGLGLNGYSFSDNLAIAGAYAPINFANRTTDKTTEWQWTAYDANADEPSIYATGTEKDFSLILEDNTVLNNVQLVGVNQTAQSDPFIFGVGKAKKEDSSNQYENCYIYSSATESDFILNSETPAIITRQDPDGDLAFYTNWGTPDKAQYSMSKLYLYHEKPAVPLYIEGVTLPMLGFTSQENFNLHIKIQKVSYPSGVGKPVLGEVIAEGDATKENINANFNIGLTAVEIPLYAEDEEGMSSELDYLFIDDEFVIVIEGWDNGTFSGVLGSQDSPLSNARPSTWFELSSEPGSMYSYSSWNTSLFVGLLGATYGYLHTDDNTNMVVPIEGGNTSIKVHPMYINSEEASGELGQTRLFLDETIEGNDIPEWLTINIANEDYDDTYTFDLVAEAEALPAGVTGRLATITFMQEGARLTITVSQGDVTGITTTTLAVDDASLYNLAGQRVNANYKGLVVKDGKKVLVK